jgi:very-short-patch-repair endonuclease
MTTLLEREQLAQKRVSTLRDKATIHEKIFLRMLRDAKIPYVFQKPFYNYAYFLIADFYLPDHRMCVELDGSQHYTPEALEKDSKRAEWLSGKDISVWHIKNRDVLKMTPNSIRRYLGLEAIKTRKKKPSKIMLNF